MNRRHGTALPYAVLCLLLATWIVLGLWICRAAPFGSGTDESIRYVAFAAATNRWASAEDAAIFRIDHSYYPPLYFLLFAPFHGDESSFTVGYPAWTANQSMRQSGSTRLVSTEDLRQVPSELWRLYRTAKAISLVFGVGIVVCLIASLRAVFTSDDRPWLILGTAGPLLLLPQFLYYQTLVNNDCLVNFLCALALYCFIAAARRTADGDAAGAGRLGVGCAIAVGLGLLTKQSAVVLLPLLPALAWLHGRASEASAPRERLAAALRHFGALTVAAFLAGGWWVAKSYLGGDLGGYQAQQATHPWAFRGAAVPEDIFTTVISGAARSFIALFAGASYGIPDHIYAIYLSVALALALALAAATACRRGACPTPARTMPGLVWCMLTVSVAVNLGLVVVYNLQVSAPQGRLFFPTLIASGVLFARALCFISGYRRRILAPLVSALVLILAGLFLWTFYNRMVPAVTQPEENLAPLGVISDGPISGLGPVWAGAVQQRILLPKGRLEGFRLLIERTSFLPQFGTVIHASLLRLPAMPGDSGDAFRPFPLGENDCTDRWTEIRLERPLDLPVMTTAMLEIWAEKPWLSRPGLDVYYNTVTLERSPLIQPLIVNGEPAKFGLALTAVYR